MPAETSCYSYPLEWTQTPFFLFPPMECWYFSSGNLDFHKGYLIRRRLPKSLFCLHSQTVAEGLEPIQSPVGFTAGTEVSLLITSFASGLALPWVPWCMVLHSATHAKALPLVDGCLIFVVKGENKNKGCVVLPWCWYYPGLGFQYLYLLIFSWMYTRGFWIRDFLFTRQKITSEWFPQSHVLPLWQWKPGQMSYVHKVCIVGKEWRKTSFLCFYTREGDNCLSFPFWESFIGNIKVFGI